MSVGRNFKCVGATPSPRSQARGEGFLKKHPTTNIEQPTSRDSRAENWIFPKAPPLPLRSPPFSMEEREFLRASRELSVSRNTRRLGVCVSQCSRPARG